MNTLRPIRVVTAASLFDGHDAAINIMRRILQAEGAEVIHLGHNRSAESVVKAAVEEDADAIAVSSYQGGHVEYFTYMLELLAHYHASHIKIFGGGGGVITPSEIKTLEERGITKIYSPDDGLHLGLVGMIQNMLSLIGTRTHECAMVREKPTRRLMAQSITTLDLSLGVACDLGVPKETKAPIIGFTGTGGAGKSSLIDELLLRLLMAFPQKKLAVLSIDPTRQKTKGALLGDRIRIGSADEPRIFMRSLATRDKDVSVAPQTAAILTYLANLDFDVVFLETAGIGQSDSAVMKLCHGSIYVMTPEYGAPSQLEKIAMLDGADMVVINKFDKPGGLDALRDVRKTLQRNRQAFELAPETMPVYGSSAHLFGDLGTNRVFNRLIDLIAKLTPKSDWNYERLTEGDPASQPLIPKKHSRYLARAAEAVRDHHQHVRAQSELWRTMEAIQTVSQLEGGNDLGLHTKAQNLKQQIDPELTQAAHLFFEKRHEYHQDHSSYQVRDKIITIPNTSLSLSQLKISKVAAPAVTSMADAVHFVGRENLPGYFPFTAGVFPFKRTEEDPTRMFAGEGSPERTNKRFHYLQSGHHATRLSTAFDSVTLYGHNPGVRPDIYGKIGNAGVSVCSLDDMKRLYSGFNLISPTNSVSMTINGPAPTMLAFFFNAAIDFQVERELKAQGRFREVEQKIKDWFNRHGISQPTYRAACLPEGHDGSGLGFLGLPSSLMVDRHFYEQVKAQVLQQVRGTIQADILKEDQAQNTCIFSTEFSLRCMGDMQEYFIKNHINNFYSVSISGYHIAEAGANPITQTAFTLANGFTLLEYYRARGMAVDDFAKNFSFFFSNGVDAEYAVIGRVARRIWAIALKNIYGASMRSQQLKYHIQTSGRSLHAQEMAYNDIRTTLQALYAIADNCNSLHTNAFDEAITTPTEESVRRAVAIQMIINHELGLMKNQNPLQGSYFIEQLTDQVEEAVLKVFESLDARGGVLGAMETMYQRETIQEESLYYEQQKLSGQLPIIGVNTFLDPHAKSDTKPPELMRSTAEEKAMQVAQIDLLAKRFCAERPAALDALRSAAIAQQNTFEHLMEAAKYCSLGEVTQSFFAVGGAYRRAM